MMTVERKQAPTPINIGSAQAAKSAPDRKYQKPKAKIGKTDPIVTVYNFNKSN